MENRVVLVSTSKISEKELSRSGEFCKRGGQMCKDEKYCGLIVYIFGGSRSEVFPEDPAEVLGIVKTYLVSYVRNVFIRQVQKLGSSF